ncbi:hypothetical protein EYF80_045849 [Liparis tanakae]|uniref:Uncharacterized protein n=1 Tax=Liparis tanakae TaxID=230148 RepID=A0A4Z2FTB6_9TELE|nr:hypothetical protein EYF80_045849 [Liparis tanakae]
MSTGSSARCRGERDEWEERGALGDETERRDDSAGHLQRRPAQNISSSSRMRLGSDGVGVEGSRCEAACVGVV